MITDIYFSYSVNIAISVNSVISENSDSDDYLTS